MSAIIMTVVACCCGRHLHLLRQLRICCVHLLDQQLGRKMQAVHACSESLGHESSPCGEAPGHSHRQASSQPWGDPRQPGLGVAVRRVTKDGAPLNALTGRSASTLSFIGLSSCSLPKGADPLRKFTGVRKRW